MFKVTWKDFWAQVTWAPIVECRLLNARQLSAATFERWLLSAESSAPNFQRTTIERGNIWAQKIERRLFGTGLLSAGQFSADFWALDNWARTIELRLLSDDFSAHCPVLWPQYRVPPLASSSLDPPLPWNRFFRCFRRFWANKKNFFFGIEKFLDWEH